MSSFILNNHQYYKQFRFCNRHIISISGFTFRTLQCKRCVDRSTRLKVMSTKQWCNLPPPWNGMYSKRCWNDKDWVEAKPRSTVSLAYQRPMNAIRSIRLCTRTTYNVTYTPSRVVEIVSAVVIRSWYNLLTLRILDVDNSRALRGWPLA